MTKPLQVMMICFILMMMPLAGCLEDTVDSESPEENEDVVEQRDQNEVSVIEGCMTNTSANYNPNATFDNGSCTYIKTYVPDDIFEAWCEGNGYGDGIAFNDSVSTFAISVLNQIDIGGKNIMDLTGIEAFTNLEYVYADNNLFQVADLRHNHRLRNFDIGNNDSLRQVYFPDTLLLQQKQNDLEQH